MIQPAAVLTRWWWVRHAPVPDNGNIYGQMDLDCDCSDTATFKWLATVLPEGALWVTSGLKRAMQTADATIAANPVRMRPNERTELSAFNEQHLGQWQGQNRAKVYAGRKLTPGFGWIAGVDERPPGGESFVDLFERTTPEIERLTSIRQGRDIIAVTHGGTIRAAIAHALGTPPETAFAFTIDNQSLSRIECLTPVGADAGPPLWRVVSVNQLPSGPRAQGVLA